MVGTLNQTIFVIPFCPIDFFFILALLFQRLSEISACDPDLESNIDYLSPTFLIILKLLKTFLFFGCPVAYGVNEPQLQPKPQLQQCWILNPQSWARDLTCVPGLLRHCQSCCATAGATKKQIYFVIFFFSHTRSIQKFPGQESNLNHSSDNAESLTTRPPGNS